MEWSDGTVETDIPARQLIEVRNSDHPLEEHGTKEGKGHGVDGHKENSMLSERKYKKRKKTKTKKRKQKKSPKYWYLGGYGHYDHDHEDFSYSGGDFGGDGGGE